MAVATLQEFLEMLRRYPLLEAARLTELRRAGLEQGTDPAALARELVRRGWLTPWQVNQLVAGRAAELVLGSYVLLDKLGEGGMGTVYKARHTWLGRVVALKVIRKERLDTDLAIRRFRREIQAAAQLSHPNIVHAFDADEVAGTHFFVMEYVEGCDLGRVVKERGPLPVAEACEYIRQAALGLEHAHERWLVHRDIKPANLLLAGARDEGPGARGYDASLVPRPSSLAPSIKLLDLGLARVQRAADEHSGTLTQEGMVMGTPDYIAPEQARDSRAADIRADLYSLGCTLYFLFAGRVPFPGGTLTDKLLKHQMDVPTPLRQLRPDVPEAVAAVVERLMAKRPEARYQAPAELVTALDLASGGRLSAEAEPIANEATRRADARRSRENPFADLDLNTSDTLTAGTIPRERPRPVRRRGNWPLIAANVGGLLVASAVVLALLLSDRVTPSADSNKRAAETKADHETPAKESAAQQEKKRQAEAAEAERRRRGEAEEVLKPLAAKAADAKPTFTDFAKEVAAFKAKYSGTPAAVKAVEILMKLPSPLDQLDPATIPKDAQTFWRAVNVSPPVVAVLGDHRQRHWDPVAAVAYSPDGKLIGVNVSERCTIFLYDAETLQLVRVLRGHTGATSGPAFAPDSRSLATTGWSNGDNSIRIWDVATGQQRAIRSNLPDGCFGLTWCPDGNGLVLSGGTHVFRVNAETLKEEWDVDAAKNVRSLAISPDGRRVAAGVMDGNVHVWDVTGEKPREVATLKAERMEKNPEQLRDNQRWVDAVTFLGDNQRLAAMYTGGFVSTWSLDQQPIREEPFEVGPVGSLAYDERTKQLAVGATGVHLFDCSGPVPKLTRQFGQEAGHYLHVAFAPNGNQLVTGGQNGVIRVWDVATGKEAQPLRGPVGPIRTISFLNDDRRLAMAGSGGRGVWDIAAGKEERRLDEVRPGADWRLSISPDGRHALCGDDGARLELWDLETGKQIRLLVGHSGGIADLALSSDGRRALSGSSDATVRLWNVETGEEPRRFGGQSGQCVAFLPDVQRAVSARPDGSICVWQAETGQLLKEIRGDWKQVYKLAASPDGHAILAATAGPHQASRLLDLDSGREIHQWHGGAHQTALAFSPDGKQAATAILSDKHTRIVRIYDTTTGGRLREWVLPGPANDLAFAHDGRHLATANANGTVYVFRLPAAASK
jgi:serine/threonine-protein kinase